MIYIASIVLNATTITVSHKFLAALLRLSDAHFSTNEFILNSKHNAF